ncbi:hypothetical protein [Photobacterium leiognathi]|uniref:hypothetical protein n=1 Tax=Photobacterium leiognathi TaxID=553611 RepID=UPI0029822637|nr:hypothetical protein [Photobacterium leiognathi]
MKSQKGMTTLLITSMLLIVALLFSLASYKNLFYQIKRTKNEVLAREAHWAAEGGLDCGFSYIKELGNISAAKASFSNCESLLNLNDVDIYPNNYISSVYLQSAKKEIKKKIRFLPESYGAIQTRSDLKLLGGIVIAPDVIDHIDDKYYQCTSVRYSSRVYVFGGVITNLPGGSLPNVTYSYPNVVTGGLCADGYNTVSGGGFDTDITPPDFDGPVEKDFEYDQFLDPFESFFNKKRSEKVLLKSEFEVITGSIADSTDNNRCAKKINEAFIISNKVWVIGDCDLHGDSLGASPTIVNQAKILVFENGIVGTSGSGSYNGAVYHLIDEPNFYNNSLIPKWEAMSSSDDYDHLLDTNSVFFANGAFVPTGGIVFDTPGGVTTYNTSLTLTYNRSFNPYTPKYKVQWLKGSWHDF